MPMATNEQRPNERGSPQPGSASGKGIVQNAPRRVLRVPHPMPTILVVDDDPGIRDNLTTLLEEEGFRVMQAGDGAQALEIATRIQPQLILSDIYMPVLDGLGLLAAIRHHQTLARIPVLLMSAIQPAAARSRGVPVIGKPFDFDQVLGMIRANLSHGSRRLSA